MRPDCKEGLRRVGCLYSLQWARQLRGLALWPTALHLSLLDRKFGGALTRADILGTDEAENEEGDGDPAAPSQVPVLVLLDGDSPAERCMCGAGTMSRSRSRCGGHILPGFSRSSLSWMVWECMRRSAFSTMGVPGHRGRKAPPQQQIVSDYVIRGRWRVPGTCWMAERVTLGLGRQGKRQS